MKVCVRNVEAVRAAGNTDIFLSLHLEALDSTQTFTQGWRGFKPADRIEKWNIAAEEIYLYSNFSISMSLNSAGDMKMIFKKACIVHNNATHELYTAVHVHAILL